MTVGWKPIVLLTTTAASLALVVGALAADPGTLKVVNRTAGYITVNVDGVYGCNTSPGSTCTIPTTQGRHDLTAQRSDTGDRTAVQVDVGAQPYVWMPWEN